VDITFEDDFGDSCGQHLGIATCTWVRELLSRYPQTQECFLTLKQLLLTHGLNSAYLGGLNSYSLALWMGAFLSTNTCASAGELLMGFLKFYGSEFNPKTTGISNTSEGKCYFSRTQPVFSPCETLDPTKADNNTTKGAYRVGEVQELFRRAQEFLSACAAHGQNKLLSRLFSKLDLIKV
jgi:DNA polymerase sigma